MLSKRLTLAMILVHIYILCLFLDIIQSKIILNEKATKITILFRKTKVCFPQKIKIMFLNRRLTTFKK